MKTLIERPNFFPKFHTEPHYLTAVSAEDVLAGARNSAQYTLQEVCTVPTMLHSTVENLPQTGYKLKSHNNKPYLFKENRFYPIPNNWVTFFLSMENLEQEPLVWVNVYQLGETNLSLKMFGLYPASAIETLSNKTQLALKEKNNLKTIVINQSVIPPLNRPSDRVRMYDISAGYGYFIVVVHTPYLLANGSYSSVVGLAVSKSAQNGNDRVIQSQYRLASWQDNVNDIMALDDVVSGKFPILATSPELQALYGHIRKSNVLDENFEPCFPATDVIDDRVNNAIELFQKTPFHENLRSYSHYIAKDFDTFKGIITDVQEIAVDSAEGRSILFANCPMLALLQAAMESSLLAERAPYAPLSPDFSYAANEVNQLLIPVLVRIPAGHALIPAGQEGPQLGVVHFCTRLKQNKLELVVKLTLGKVTFEKSSNNSQNYLKITMVTCQAPQCWTTHVNSTDEAVTHIQQLFMGCSLPVMSQNSQDLQYLVRATNGFSSKLGYQGTYTYKIPLATELNGEDILDSLVNV